MRLLVGILLVHGAAWLLAVTLRPGLMPQRQMAAEALSTLALVLMTTNLVLATRARGVERLLVGLDKVFVTHRTIGISVSLVALSHFLLVPKSVGYVPSKPVGYTTLTLLLLGVFIASAPRFPWRRLVPMRYELWKTSHKLMGLILVLAASHSLLAHTYVRQVPLLAAYVYTVASVGLLAWLYREFLFPVLRPNSIHTVDSTDRHPRLCELFLSPPLIARRSGQFVFLELQDGQPAEAHPFTISSGPDEPVRLSIKASGDFTSALPARVNAGSHVRLEGPYGAFNHERGRQRQLWLAGGIGITPFLSMARAIAPPLKATLIWSVHDAAEAIYDDELKALSATGGFSYRLHSSSESGHLDIATLRLPAPAADCSVFICGPLPMRTSALKSLRELGVQRSEIYFEEFRLR